MIRITFILLLISVSVGAQVLNFNHFSIEHGLLQSQVYAITQDQNRNIWIGTYSSGITVYNGVNIRYFTSEDGLPSHSIMALHCDKKGNVWVGTMNGLVYYDGKSFVDVDSVIGKSLIVWAFSEDKNGVIWMGSQHGLFSYKDGKLNEHGDSLIKGNDVYSICCDYKNNVFMYSVNTGIVKYDGKTYNHHFLDTLDGAVISAIFEDHLKNLWFGGVDGLYLYSNKDKELIRFGKESIMNTSIEEIVQDKYNNIWAATYGGGVSVYNGNTMRAITMENGLSYNRLNTIFKDFEDNIWIGTDGMGVNIFNNFIFRHYDFTELSNTNIVMSVLVDDEKDEVWFGLDGGGLVLLKNEVFKLYTIKDGLANNHIYHLFKDSKRNLWIGTEDGFSCFDGYRFKNYNIKDGLPSASVLTVMEDHQGVLWIGTYDNGVSKFDGKTFTNFSTEDGIADDFIWDIHQGDKEDVYIATNKGLTVFKGDSFTTFTTDHGLINNSVVSIREDKNNLLWLATDNGLSRFDGSSFKNYTKKEGLTSNLIYLLEFDDKGRLILGNEKGLDILTLDKNSDIIAVKHYGLIDGFKGIECNSNAISKDKYGRLWIGTIGGVTMYDPAMEKFDAREPKTYITNMKLFSEDVDWSRFADSIIPSGFFNFIPVDLKLPYTQNNLTFEFACIDYYIPDKVHYQFMLKGFDKDWEPITSKNYARYTNISPGEYVFMVRASNHTGIWNKEPVKFSFEIIPPIWMRTWFFIVCVIIIIIMVYGFIVIRTRRLQKAKKQLAEMVKLKTFEVLQQKEEIEEKNRNLELAYKDITDSVIYAKRIQEAILPPVHHLTTAFPDSFIFYKPKDIVSGDFYWFVQKGNVFLVVAADCTGHGVPGAFMSMIASNLLSQIVNDKNVLKASSALKLLDEQVICALKQNDEHAETNDGMDLALCAIYTDSLKLNYAGAYRPLIIVRDGELIEHKASKFAIGGYFIREKIFKDEYINLKKGDQVYLFTDGFIDQFGGESGRKFMINRFKELIIKNHKLPMGEQANVFESAFTEWQGDTSQIDDVLVIGIRI